jgi:lipopolysaccharide transport system permease protein
VFASLISNRWLLLNFVSREFSARYAGSSLGVVWAILNPLALLAIYAFIFGHFFKQRFPGMEEQSYTLLVAVALWPWMMFADGITRGMATIQANAGLIRKVAFPNVLLVYAGVLGTFGMHLLGYIAALLLLALLGNSIRWAGIPWALLLLVFLLVFTIGVAALLAALQTLLKDVEQVLPPALMMVYFLTPVLYPLSIIPEAYRGWLQLNPLAHFVQRIRDVLLVGGGLVTADLTLAIVSILVCIFGLAVFNRLSPHFEDFL